MAGGKKKQRRKKAKSKIGSMEDDEADSDQAAYTNDDNVATVERQREHPFIVTEPGEVARGKKNGLDYLFHLYEQCRDFLVQVQSIAKEKGEKCPTKVIKQLSLSLVAYCFFFFLIMKKSIFSCFIKCK